MRHLTLTPTANAIILFNGCHKFAVAVISAFMVLITQLVFRHSVGKAVKRRQPCRIMSSICRVMPRPAAFTTLLASNKPRSTPFSSRPLVRLFRIQDDHAHQARLSPATSGPPNGPGSRNCLCASTYRCVHHLSPFFHLYN